MIQFLHGKDANVKGCLFCVKLGINIFQILHTGAACTVLKTGVALILALQVKQVGYLQHVMN